MIITCAIIDDEPLARKGLKEYIGEIDFLQLTGEYDTPLRIMDRTNEELPQLIFLDIQMPKLTGLDFLKTLQYPPLVIITTAFPQYALEGFELNVLDYLVKPVSFNRFVKAVMKAKDYCLTRVSPGAANDEGDSKQGDHVFIKADNRLVKIFYSDILFVEALQNYITIHTKDRKYITCLTFRTMEENLPAAAFLKVHKSYIIQLNKIDSIEGNMILIGRHTIPISRQHKEEIMQKIVSGKFLKR